MSNQHRVSKAYIPITAFKYAKPWLILLAINLVSPISNELGTDWLPFISNSLLITLAILLTIIICTLASLLSYPRLSWKIEGEEVYITKGIFKRVNKRIPVSKIQSVDMIESLPERIFSVATIKIDTAGGEGDDGKIPCMSKEEARALRSSVFALKNASVMAEESAANIEPFESSAETAANPVTTKRTKASSAASANTLYKMPAKNLILTGLSSSKTVIFALIIIGGAGELMQLFSGTELYESLSKHLLGMAIPLIVFFSIVFFVICWVISAIAMMINNFGFTVRNAGAKVEIERGLIEHKTASIEKNRIQEVTVTQGFITKIIGYAEISVKTATLKAQGEASNGKNGDILGQNIIHPFIKISEVDYFIENLLPDFADAPKTFTALPKRAHLRSVRRYVIWTLICLALVTLFVASIASMEEQFNYFDFIAAHPAMYLAYIIPLAWAVITGYRSYLGKGLAITNDFLSIRVGAYGRKTSLIPRRKIQRAIITSNPFQRRQKLSTLRGTTGAIAFSARLIDVETTDAESYLEWTVNL